MNRIPIPALFTALVWITAASTYRGVAAEPQWGTLKGQLLYDGTAPAPKEIIPTKDTQVCGKCKLTEEMLIVAKDGGVLGAVIYLRPEKGKKLDVHPDYQASAADKVQLDNNCCRFEPRICLLRTSQTLVIKNSDAVGHNTNVATFANMAVNPLVPAATTVDAQFPKEETTPMPVSCNIHPWMKAYVLIRENPYMAATDKSGAFEIKDLPAGEHEFQFWQEQSAFLNLTIAGKQAKKGRLKLTIKPGLNDLGQIKLEPKLFEKKP